MRIQVIWEFRECMGGAKLSVMGKEGGWWSREWLGMLVE
jgi:hypothetical protein